MATREEKRAELIKEHKAAKATVRRLELHLKRRYPVADAVETQEMKTQLERAHAELKKLDRKVTGGGRTSPGAFQATGVV